MTNKILVTVGQGHFEEQDWERPKCGPNEIAVKSVLTGVCRSDIDMMQGNFGPLPTHMSGHEGLGQVIEVGADIKHVAIGNYVATRGEPAYADEYNVRADEFVVVPSADPKYILEPVACGINLLMQPIELIYQRTDRSLNHLTPSKRLLILGSGFLAWVAYNTIKIKQLEFEVDVVGSSNKDIWGDILNDHPFGKYDVIIDLSSSNILFNDVPIFNDDALIIFGAQKEVKTNFAPMLWKAVTMVFPSPRNPKFIRCMKDAEQWITSGILNVDKFWTRGYNRDTEWQQAFNDGADRPINYSRGYIKWN
jgi:threonine dehydrogenase-like Zn-dependent dehydrogenase